MKVILLVDDDGVVRETYRNALAREGYRVEVAADGLMAASALSWMLPDLVILDLMMPKLSGVEVLKFLRSDPGLKSTPVVVLTNAFLEDLMEPTSLVGVQQTLNKADCTPAKLAQVIRGLLSEPEPAPNVPEQVASEPAAPKQPVLPEVNLRARQDFLNAGAPTIGAMREMFEGLKKATETNERGMCLEQLYRESRWIASTAGLVDCPDLALLGGALEALLFELTERPQAAEQSVLRTIAQTLDFLTTLFATPEHVSSRATVAGKALVVDDDAVSARAALQALWRAKVQGQVTVNPLQGLELLRREEFDLILVDVEMPEISGFEFCKRLRALPNYANTPVIFVTLHGDFRNRAQSALCGGNDLISKPFFPIELAVKAVLHLVKSRREASARPAAAGMDDQVENEPASIDAP